MGISGGPYIVRDSSLVLELDAADKNSYPGSGTTWNDLSGNNNSGSLVASPTFNSGNNGGIVLNGTTQYVSFGNISSLILSNNSFTISYWLVATGTARVDFFNIKNFNALQDDIGLFINTSNKFCAYFQIQNSTTGTGLSTSTATLLRGTIYNLICVKNSSQQIVQYINGVLDNNTNNSLLNTSTVASSPLLVGTNKLDASTLSFSFAGTIYSAQIYNRALSATEILQNYNEQKSRFGL
jgi:hypothetical protein